MSSPALSVVAQRSARIFAYDGETVPIGHPIQTEHGSPECWIAGHWERRHGSHCACRLLAAAAGAEPSAVDYGFCRRVLQKRWRMTCDHVPHVSRKKLTPVLPPRDLRDPVHALLIANADFSPD